MPQHPTQTDDPDVQKGAVEGDRPDQPQNANPHGPGVNDQGLPDDPVAIAEDPSGRTRMSRRVNCPMLIVEC